MNIHKNARLTPLRREEMALSTIEGTFSKAHPARVYGVSAKRLRRVTDGVRQVEKLGLQIAPVGQKEQVR